MACVFKHNPGCTPCGVETICGLPETLYYWFDLDQNGTYEDGPHAATYDSSILAWPYTLVWGFVSGPTTGNVGDYDKLINDPINYPCGENAEESPVDLGNFYALTCEGIVEQTGELVISGYYSSYRCCRPQMFQSNVIAKILTPNWSLSGGFLTQTPVGPPPTTAGCSPRQHGYYTVNTGGLVGATDNTLITALGDPSNTMRVKNAKVTRTTSP